MDIYAIRKANLIALIGNRVKRECADKWEMAPAHLSQVLSSRTKKNLGDDVARRIEDREGLPRGWLDTLRADGGPLGLPESNVEPGPDIKGLVPLISWVQAGDWCEVEDHYAVGDAEDWLPCPTAHGPRTYVLRVRGESMNNPHARRSFRDGDLIYVDPDRLAENGSAVIAKLEDSQEATFKQLVVEGEDRYLKPLNPGWPEPIIKVTEKATICGVVIGKYEVF